jgi:urease accessory protein UreH
MVESNALLVFAPEPVQAFADSIYRQRQEWHLVPSAGLALLDWYCSGRPARGERWAFARLQTRNDVFVDGRRTFLDSVLLDRSECEMNRPHRTGRFDCIAMLLLVGAPLRVLAGQMLNDMAARPVGLHARVVCSASPVAAGAVLRVAGEQVEEVAKELQQWLRPLAASLGDDPWKRKW